MKACVCTLYDDNFRPFVDYILRSLAAYAARNRMDMVSFDGLLDLGLSPSWNKLLAIKECFAKGGYSKVLWIDADSVALRKAPPLCCLVPFGTHFMVNSDDNGLAMGEILVNDSDYSMKLIDTMLFLGSVKDWERFGVNNPGDEQNCLKALNMHFNVQFHFFPRGFSIPVVTRPEWENDATSFYHLCKLTADERLKVLERLSQEGKILG